MLVPTVNAEHEAGQASSS